MEVTILLSSTDLPLKQKAHIIHIIIPLLSQGYYSYPMYTLWQTNLTMEITILKLGKSSKLMAHF